MTTVLSICQNCYQGPLLNLSGEILPNLNNNFAWDFVLQNQAQGFEQFWLSQLKEMLLVLSDGVDTKH
jgi:hypothetical protein